MVRKIIYGVFVALLGCLIFLLYVRLQNKDVSVKRSYQFESIPSDAGLIIHSDKPLEFLHKMHIENLVWQQLRSVPFFHESSLAMAKLDSLFSSGAVTDLEMNIRSMTYSLHPQHENGLAPLLVFKLSSKPADPAIKKLMSLVYGSEVQFISKAYNDFSLVTMKDSLQVVLGAYCAYKNALLWSNSDLLIEKCIGDVSAGLSVESNEDFKQISAIAGKNVDANLFLNFKVMGSIIGEWMNEEHYLDEETIKKIGSWAALDFHPEGQSLLLDGFMTYGASDEFMVRFKNQDPVMMTSVGIMPQTTQYFHSLGITDLDAYLLYYPNSVTEKEKLDAWSGDWESKYGVAPLELLTTIFGGELAKARTLNADNDQNYLLIKLKSNTSAQEYFDGFFSNLSQKQNTTIRHFKKSVKVDDATSYDYYQFSISPLFGKFFGPLFESEKLDAFVFYDNYMVIGKNERSLKDFLYQNLLGQTLAESVYYSEFEKNLSVKSNFQIYADFRGTETLLDFLFDKQFVKTEVGDAKHIKALNAIGLQLVGSQENVYSNLYIDYAGKRKEEAQAVWKSLLDTSFIQKPTLVENHYTHENEICVQDLKNVLYLISPSGRIIWKKALSEPILGRIFQIDKFKNGKLQLLFNTASQVHLLDRNGNYVNRYPYNLASEAVGELGLVDYDNNRDYRIFIPCKDKSVLLFDKDGSKLEGWTFKGADYPVTSRINHFRLDGKDFIVFADKNRVYLLNRQGQVRLRIKEQFSMSENGFFSFDENGPKGEPCLVTTDVKGTVKYIYFNGNIETLDVGRFSSDHAFRYEDLDGDKREELIFTDKNMLSVFNHKGTRLFEHKLPHSIAYLPYVYEFSSREKKIGLVDSRDNNLYLYNSDGTPFKGFPLTGNTPFTLGFLKNQNGSFNLITGGEGNYIYNYRVK